MINSKKIEEWIHEVEERPVSAPIILRIIANRLSDLSKWNEELLNENILLRSGQKVDEYENRIANLEYQLELLKRQVSGEFPAAHTGTISLVIYNSNGHTIRIELDPKDLVSNTTAAAFRNPEDGRNAHPQLLLTPTQEELLFLFDSGRTATLAVSDVPAAERKSISWEQAILQEPRGGEELAAVIPVAKMALFEFCVQASRRGYVKKTVEAFFENHLAKQYIGTGVNLATDRTCRLVFGDKSDIFAMASREGAFFGIEIGQLPFSIQEGLNLRNTDHVISAFNVRGKPFIAAVTQNGKILHREADWLEPVSGLKNKGQALISRSRLDKGARLVGAAAVDEEDWGAVLESSGKMRLHKMADLFAAGSLFDESAQTEVLSFCAYGE